jgi:hypothetical protein
MNADESSNQPDLSKSDGQEKARLIQEHRVNASDEGLTGVVAAGQVPSDHFTSYRQKARNLERLGCQDAEGLI